MLPQHFTSGVITCELVVLPSWYCFRNPDALNLRLCLVRMSGSDWGGHSKSCCKTPLVNMAVSTAWQISRGPANSSTTGVWDVLCHILSRAEEEVMRECDINYTRAINTSSAVNLSRKPGLDLCCDLLQHLPGVPRTCSFTLSYVHRFYSSHHHSNCLSYEM